MHTLTPPQTCLCMFIALWTIGQICLMSYSENLWFTIVGTLSQAYYHDLHIYLWNKLTSKSVETTLTTKG